MFGCLNQQTRSFLMTVPYILVLLLTDENNADFLMKQLVIHQLMGGLQCLLSVLMWLTFNLKEYPSWIICITFHRLINGYLRLNVKKKAYCSLKPKEYSDDQIRVTNSCNTTYLLPFYCNVLISARAMHGQVLLRFLAA
jgi:hypothetical protein